VCVCVPTAYLALDVVLVLDVSGSMSGAKIALVRESVVRMLELLSPRDQVSIVTFNSTAQRHTPLLRVHGDGLAQLVSKVRMPPRPRLHSVHQDIMGTIPMACGSTIACVRGAGGRAGGRAGSMSASANDG
jgi:hypothetical protein